ncbi:NAD(P)/FAD-dependent oxidoreductase [Niastella populi]|nr:NAD(P)/FAD-dependent oxidoreductase [Niastella populi]
MNAFDYEVAVIGGSHAGLAAAHTLGRSKRRTIVFDAGTPRNSAAQSLHNFSTGDGASPNALRSIALAHLNMFENVRYLPQPVSSVNAAATGFQLTAGNEILTVRKIILATGVTDKLFAIEGLAALWGRTVLHCTYCHGWEARDQPALVLVKGAIAWDVAITISHWNPQLTFLLNGSTVEDAEKKTYLQQRGWRLIETPVIKLTRREEMTEALLADGQVVAAPVVYTKPVQVKFNNELAVKLGCEISKSGSVLTDGAMQTSVQGVFAAGDVAHPGYHLVAEAIATGHKAAAFCNNQLCKEDYR